ncbi:MAG: UDP-N-acetylglucosamine--N-acetylmuramyl-(pentapeptide) pyrophosphoryl-undecaprenol N-acetylglucosamine transferase [Candidatus Daviesbacteria bacterium]|nr:UDP-N-acetylglucosamine--N-acetylmuramyl-(pentapeptide) pyrophosphoryl-undecaprenol N-acetylglucosamine transferase [Candidatus Daviesbacteria bacterium]
MKVIITGAHFTPALGVIEELKKIKGIEIVYVGRNFTQEGDQTKSQESLIIPGLGVKFINLTAGRLRKDWSFYAIISILKIPIGFIQAIQIIFREKPDVLLSFGGYVGLPMVVAGWLFSVPTIIHEQTLVSGLTNKISSIFADKIAASFENEKNKSFILTGNPIRQELLNPSKKIRPHFLKLFKYADEHHFPVILVMGGNQGSHVINVNIEKSLPKILKIACIVHLSGDSKYRDYERLKKWEGENYLVEKWIGQDFGSILSKVDLVISRAGINSLLEMANFGKPALVIPLPHLYQDEQYVNARYFEKLGMVKILPQSRLSEDNLVSEIKNMIKNIESLTEGAKEAKQIIIPDAAKRLALETITPLK